MPKHKNKQYSIHHSKLAKELDLSISALSTLRGLYFSEGQRDLKQTLKIIESLLEKKPNRTYYKEALDFITYAEEEHIKFALLPNILSIPLDHLTITSLLGQQ